MRTHLSEHGKSAFVMIARNGTDFVLEQTNEKRKVNKMFNFAAKRFGLNKAEKILHFAIMCKPDDFFYEDECGNLFMHELEVRKALRLASSKFATHKATQLITAKVCKAYRIFYEKIEQYRSGGKA